MAKAPHPPLDEARLQMKLAGARERVKNLIVLGMKPGVSAETREALHKVESWTRSEVKVHRRLLEDFRARKSRPRRAIAMKNPASKQLDLFVDTPQVAVPKDPRLDEALLLKELANTRREVRNLIVIGMRPDLPADKRELIHKAERSARAEVKLRIKALWYCREQQRGGR
jgi:hypothetical protein